MAVKENTKMHRDRSPAISPEEKRKHDLEEEKFKYKIALDELSVYIGRSTLQTALSRGATNEHTWTDHRGQAWVTENPISPPARTELKTLLKVVHDYESKYGEKGREAQALTEITAVRAAGREQKSQSRSAYFEKQVAQPSPANTSKGIEIERIPEQGIEVER